MDFLQFESTERFDCIYDHAALVALNTKERRRYSKVIKKCMNQNTLYLINMLIRDKVGGPPYSVKKKELGELFWNYDVEEKYFEKEKEKEKNKKLMIDNCSFVIQKKE